METKQRTSKNIIGDWVAVPAHGVPGGHKPAKIIATGYEQDMFGDEAFVVTVRDQAGESRKFEGPLPRIQWSRERGRNRWKIIAR